MIDERGDVTVSVKARYVKLWEQRPAEILDEPDVNALPLIGAMNATREDLVAVIRRLNAVADPEHRSRLLAELAVWSSLNYNEVQIEEIRAEMSMTLKDLMLISPIGEELAREKWEEGQEKGLQRGLQQGLQQGIQRGLQQGVLEQARRDILFVAGRRFPEKLDPAIIDKIGDSEKLRAILDALIVSGDWNSVQAVLDRIAEA